MPASRTTADATPAPIRRELSFREFVVLGAWMGGRRWPALSLWVHSIQALTPR